MDERAQPTYVAKVLENNEEPQRALSLADLPNPPASVVPHAPERSPLMDALYDVALMTPTVNWKISQYPGGLRLQLSRRGYAAQPDKLVPPADAWRYSRREWVETILRLFDEPEQKELTA